MTMYHNQVRFLSEIQGWVNIKKSFYVIHHINRIGQGRGRQVMLSNK